MSIAQREFKKGVEHYLAERLSGAERSLRKVIKHDPKHGDALHLLGLIALRSGQAKAGERRIRQAIAAVPGNPVYHGSLGAALREQGQSAAALAAYAAALALNPDYAIAWQNSAQIEADLGHSDAAITAFRRAIALDPGDAVAHFGLANVLAEVDAAAAEPHYRAALEIDEDYVEAWNNLGNLMAEGGRLILAAGAFREAIRRRPDDAALPLNMAKKLEAGGQLDEAGAAYAEALEVDGGNAAALAGLAALTAYRGDDAGAAELFERLLALEPDNPRTHAAIAGWHEAAGRSDTARAAAEQSLTLTPGHAEATLMLAQLDRRDGNLEAARARLEGLSTDGEDGACAFELGRVRDRLGDYDAAFAAFERGNTALDQARNAGRFDGVRYLSLVREIGATVTKKAVAAWPKAIADDGLATPIFFVGFPRSGTTLMEQILDAHDDLISIEELPLLEAARRRMTEDAAYPAALGDLSPALIADMRRSYWQAANEALGEAPGQAVGARRLIDKLPLNIVHLGLVRRIFPDAQIIVALRDPRDVVLSCFMQSFTPNDAMVHFRDVDAAADLYAEVMANWRAQQQCLGLDTFDYRYEDLVADPATVAAGVLKFLGLPWQDSVLDYHSRKRARLVMTPSYQDVREPVYNRAVARWRHYADALAPVQARLAPFVAAFGYED